MRPITWEFPFTLWVVPLEIQLFSNQILRQINFHSDSTTNDGMFPETHTLLCGSRQNYIMKSFSQKSTLTCALTCVSESSLTQHGVVEIRWVVIIRQSVRLELRHTQAAHHEINLQVLSVELQSDYYPLFIDCPAPRYITPSTADHRAQSHPSHLNSGLWLTFECREHWCYVARDPGLCLRPEDAQI